MWTVQNAKAHLSELLRLAKAGEPRVIGTQDPCIVISARKYQTLTQANEPHLGRWLVANAPAGPALQLPSRADSRIDPFDESKALRRGTE